MRGNPGACVMITNKRFPYRFLCSCMTCCVIPTFAFPIWPCWIACDRDQLVRMHNIDDSFDVCTVGMGGLH